LHLGRKAKKNLGTCLRYLRLGRQTPFHRGINQGEGFSDNGHTVAPPFLSAWHWGGAVVCRGRGHVEGLKVSSQEEKKCSPGELTNAAVQLKNTWGSSL